MSREIEFKVCNKKTGRTLAWEKLTENGWEFAYADAPNIWACGVFEEAVMGAGYLDGIVRYMHTGLHDKNGLGIYEGCLLGYKEYTVPDHTGLWKVAWNGYMWDIITEFGPRFNGDKEKGSYEGGKFFWNCYSNMAVAAKATP